MKPADLSHENDYAGDKGLMEGLREAASSLSHRLARVFNRKPEPITHSRTASGPVGSGPAAPSSHAPHVLSHARSARNLDACASAARRTADGGDSALAAPDCEALAEGSGISGWIKLDWMAGRSKPAVSRISLAKGSITLHHRKLQKNPSAGRPLATMSTPHPELHSSGDVGNSVPLEDVTPPAQRFRNARSLRELPLNAAPPPPPPPPQLPPRPPLQDQHQQQRRDSNGISGGEQASGYGEGGLEEPAPHSAPMVGLVRPAPLALVRQGSLRAGAAGGSDGWSSSPAGGGGSGGKGHGAHRPRPPPLMMPPGGHGPELAAGGSPNGGGGPPLPRPPLRSRTLGHSAVSVHATCGLGAGAGAGTGGGSSAVDTDSGAGLGSWPGGGCGGPSEVGAPHPSPKQIGSPAAGPCNPRVYRPSSPGVGQSPSSAAPGAAGTGGAPSPRSSVRLMRFRAQSNPGLGLASSTSGGASPAGSGPGSPLVLSGGGAGVPAPSVPPAEPGLLALPPPGPPTAGGAACRSPRHSTAGYAGPSSGSFRLRQHAQAQADSRLARSSSWRTIQAAAAAAAGPAAAGSPQLGAQPEPAPAPMVLPAHWRHEAPGARGGDGSGGGSDAGSGGGAGEGEGGLQLAPGSGSTPGPGPRPASGSSERLSGALLGTAGEGIPMRSRGGLLPPLKVGRGSALA